MGDEAAQRTTSETDAWSAMTGAPGSLFFLGPDSCGAPGGLHYSLGTG